jgi:hypothetical protein
VTDQPGPLYLPPTSRPRVRSRVEGYRLLTKSYLRLLAELTRDEQMLDAETVQRVRLQSVAARSRTFGALTIDACDSGCSNPVIWAKFAERLGETHARTHRPGED